MNPSRRRLLAGVAGGLAGTAGCLSGGASTADAPEIGTVADSETPTGGQPLPPPVAGDPDAEVTVAVFEDYACPHCATYSTEVFPKVAENHLVNDDVRYEFHDLPIPVDEQVSWQAASAARAVQAAAGPQDYYVYSERLFANQDSLGPEQYAALTEGLDVDGDTVRSAATDESYRPTVTADRQRGIDRGVEGTPTVFVDGSRVEWQEIAYEPIRDAIESARSQ